MVETGREIIHQNGHETSSLPHVPHTRHRTPSFTLASIDASGAHPGAFLGADSAAFVSGANGGDPIDHDAVNVEDSVS